MKMSEHKKAVRKEIRQIKKIEQEMLDVSRHIDETKELTLSYQCSNAINKIKRTIDENKISIRVEIEKREGEEALLE